ncbi:MFS transporter [Pluralibacter gergoviae]|uniref:MFS transporter n=1 Tax=Pluralibacter gergoviae TaxID=61647 RepID=UPI00190D4C6E|nr:MFS transporter [Pluralibacter gergoviae]MBK4115810.1 MFS transporter [Pluralibacter gergoviae]
MASPDRTMFQQIIDKRFSGYQLSVCGLCFLVALFDGFDTQAVAFTGPAIIDAFNANISQLAPVMTAGIAGMTLGAVVMGMMGDRLGRRTTLLCSILIFGITTLSTAFSTSLETLFLLRIFAGFGMGGATPVLLALASEYSPHRHRGLVTTGVLLALPAGAMSGGLLAAWVLPIWGWQSIYLIGGIFPLALFIVMYFYLPDSLEYLCASSRAQNHQKVMTILRRISQEEKHHPVETSSAPRSAQRSRLSLKNLFTAEYKLTTIGVWSVYFLNWVAWFMLLSWLPTLLKQAGLAPDQTPMASVTVNAAFILFALPLAYFLPRINIMNVLWFMFATGIAVAACLIFAVPAQNWLAVFLLIGLAGFGIGGQQLALNYLVVATYPPHVRATAMGWAIGTGRLGAIFGSGVGGIVLAKYGASGFFAILIIPLALSALSVLLIRRRYHRQKKSQNAVV